MDTVKRYLNQPSTWRGLAMVLSAFGIVVAPGSIEAIGAGFVAVMGLIETVRDGDKR